MLGLRLKPQLQAAVRRLRPQGLVHVMDVAQWLEERDEIRVSERLLQTMTGSNWPKSARGGVSRKRNMGIATTHRRTPLTANDYTHGNLSAEPLLNSFTTSPLSRLSNGEAANMKRPGPSGYPYAQEQRYCLP